VDVREWPWFRATEGVTWHVVEARQDLELRAVCGYSHRWATAEQTRSSTPPGPSCDPCLRRAGLERRNGVARPEGLVGRRRDD
jgi:hypothetical protein